MNLNYVFLILIFFRNVREEKAKLIKKEELGLGKDKRMTKYLKVNSLNSPCFHSLPHMCTDILKIILNIYGHLYPQWIY